MIKQFIKEFCSEVSYKIRNKHYFESFHQKQERVRQEVRQQEQRVRQQEQRVRQITPRHTQPVVRQTITPRRTQPVVRVEEPRRRIVEPDLRRAWLLD